MPPRLLPTAALLPALPPSLPQRAYPRWMRAGGRLVLRTLGWRFSGGFADAPRQVLIGAPHTSNWDGVVCLAAVAAVGIPVDVLAKRQLFRGPVGWLLRSLGGVPVDRDQPGGLVGKAVARLTGSEPSVVAVAPEGTRGPVAAWRTGFHRMAVEAGVPIAVLGIDWGRREIALRGTVVPTSELAADLAAIGGLLEGVEGKHPDRATLPPPERTGA